MFNIAEELKKLPDQPGVYIMHDSHDAIIYIGKAVSLRKRVHQYFQPSHDEASKGTDGKTDRTFRVYYYGLGIRGACVGVQPDQGTLSKIQYHAAR